MVLSQSPLVRLSDVSKSYPGVKAADRVSIDFFAGETVGLVGKNGAGKSTIIRLLAGVETPDSGQIFIQDKPYHQLDAATANTAGIAVLHQELNDVPMLSVAENILLGLNYPRRAGMLVDQVALRKSAQKVLNALNMDFSPKRLVSTLSVAERRMVMIARCLIQNAKLIILDEPTASLSDKEIDELQRIVRHLRASGVCVVYVSHRLQEIFDLCDRVVVMRDGQVVDNQNTTELDQTSLVRLIAGQDIAKDDLNTRPVPLAEDANLEVLAVSGLDPLQTGRSLSLSLRKGEVLGLAGLAGSGRSELLMQLMAADDGGAVLHKLNRQPVRVASPRAAVQSGMSMVSEDRLHEGIIPGFNVAQNISLSSLNRHRIFPALPFPKRTREYEQALSLCKDLSIKTPNIETGITKLSGGNQQKVLIGRCLAADADIFILDEPTHGIDVEAKEEIYALVQKLTESGKSVLVVSSELSELERMCHRVLVMRDGDIVDELQGADITETAILSSCLAPDTRNSEDFAPNTMAGR